MVGVPYTTAVVQNGEHCSLEQVGDGVTFGSMEMPIQDAKSLPGFRASVVDMSRPRKFRQDGNAQIGERESVVNHYTINKECRLERGAFPGNNHCLSLSRI